MADDTVSASVHIDAPPERVYEYFTRPEAIVSWMGDYALLDPQPGGRFELDIKGAPVRGRFLELDPPHRLLLSWGYAGSDRLPPGASTVEVRFIPDRGGTRVDLRHRDLPAGQRAPHASGWTHYLARAQVAACGHDPGPDPGMPQAMSAEVLSRHAAQSVPMAPTVRRSCVPMAPTACASVCQWCQRPAHPRADGANGLRIRVPMVPTARCGPRAGRCGALHTGAADASLMSCPDAPAF